MVKTKHSIKVLPGEKELYRIFKELERYGRSTFSYPDNLDKQRGIARSIGVRGKSLVERDLFFPPTVTRHRYPPINAVLLPANVVVVEKKEGNFSRFYFHKIYNKF